MPHRRRLILHIGIEKTGSTSIQDMLSTNRELLFDQGFAYLRSPGGTNHTHLAIFAGSEAATRELCASIPGGREHVVENLQTALAAEISALPSSVRTVILSNEHCHSRLGSRDEIDRLKTLLDTFFEDYKIVVYLRRQDELAVSLYSTLLRGGYFSRRDILPGPNDWSMRSAFFFKYANMIEAWQAVFGRCALDVRLFEKNRLADGDVTIDFARICGLDTAAFAPTPKKNQSLNAVAQELFRRIGERQAAAQALRHRSMQLFRFMDDRYTGQGRQPTRTQARAFFDRFAEQNERLRSEYFPDQPSLFSTDFSRYPEQESLPSTDAILDASLVMIGGMAQEIRRLNAQLLIGRGDLELARGGDQTEAMRYFELALSYQPGNALALRALIRLAKQGTVAPALPHHLRRAQVAAPGQAKAWTVMEHHLRTLGQSEGRRRPRPSRRGPA